MQQIFSQKLRFKDENGEDYPDWEEKKFETIINYGKAGGTPTSTNKNYYGGQIPFLSISDMTSQGKYIKSTEKLITKAGLNNSSAWIVPENSLLYSIYASVGSVAINKSDISTSQAIFGIILDENIVEIEYIYYYLLDYKKYIHKFIETGTQGNLNAKTVRNLVIKVPSQNEQTKISNYLSFIDIKIEQLSKEVKINKKFKKGLLQQMFC
ncbi:Type I restriction modification DNA specificity domain protein [anaerobic digester metagenome]